LAASEERKIPPLASALNEIIVIAQTVLEMDIGQLMTPGACKKIIGRIMMLQNQWKNNAEWPCRDHVLRLLLVFASVARMVEHLEEDARMWNYVAKDPLRGGDRGADRERDREKGMKGRVRPPVPRRDSFSSAVSDEDTNFTDSGAEWSDSAFGREMDPGLGTFPKTRRRKRSSLIPPKMKQEHLSLTELRAAADEGQSVNVMMEFRFDGTLQYISPVSQLVFGYSAEELVGKTDLPFLPSKSSSSLNEDGAQAQSVFGTASASLTDEHDTAELTYKARRRDGRWLEMEGKGMVNFDRLTGTKRSTIWVTRPVALLGEGWEESGESEGESSEARDGMSEESGSNVATPELTRKADVGGFEARLTPPSSLPNSRSNSLQNLTSPTIHIAPPTPAMHKSDSLLSLSSYDLVLCHICERSIPAVLFEEHSIKCSDVHRCEMNLQRLGEEMDDVRMQCLQRIKDIDVELEKETAGDLVLYLEELKRCVTEVAGVLETALSIPIPDGVEDEGSFWSVAADEDDEKKTRALRCLEWKCGQESEYYPPGMEGENASNMVVIGLGLGAYNLSRDVQALLEEKGAETERMKMAVRLYRDLGLREEQVKLEIGIKTGSIVGSEGEVVEGTPSGSEAGISKSPSRESQVEMERDPSVSSTATAFKAGFFPKKSGSREREKDGKKKKGKKKGVKGGRSMHLNTLLRDDYVSPKEEKDNERERASKPKVFGREKSFEVEVIPSPKLSTPKGGWKEQQRRDSRDRKEVEPPSPSTPPPGQNFGSSVPLSSSATSPSVISRSVPSIKDFEIIKPISKGAFGSVYLAKKRLTGDYFAIKVLKKADMVAKNQVMNIKAERMILTQLDSPYVVKLYFSFQSRDNLYLVMEYLNGGDCAALVKAMGCLDEKWAKQYCAEVVLGLEFLHSRGIVHR